MALNGSGVFTRLYTWVTDRNNSVKITASRMDAEMDGMATALSTALYKDGQQVPTANLPMGGFKLTGLGDATVATDAMNRQAADARYLSIATAVADLKANLDEAVHTTTVVASATTTDIGAAATDRVSITGTTTITSLGTSIDRIRFVSFAGALILTHNATSLILPTAANITTVAGDCAIFASDASGNWRCLSYDRADGSPLVVTTASIAANAVTLAKFATQAASTILANLTGGAAVPTAATPTAVLDLFSTTRGVILTRNAADWVALGVGAAGQYLKSGGAGADISWSTLFGTQAEMEAASSLVVAASPGNLNFHPGVAKAWVAFTGTGTVTITASHNVSSITDNGTGDYTVNFTTAFSSANYVPVGTGRVAGAGQGGLVSVKADTAPTASACRLLTIAVTASSSTGLQDFTTVTIAFFGDQ